MSRANRARRAANRAETARWLAGQHARPEVIAYRDAQAKDPAITAQVEADRHAQAVRLLNARWVHRQDAGDGLGMWDQPRYGLRIIHSIAREDDGHLWGHVSVSRRDQALPGWLEVRDAQWLLYPDRVGLIVVAPQSEHVNLREVAHVWTRLTGDGPPIPDFTHGLGTI